MENLEKHIVQFDNIIKFEGFSFFVIDHLDSLDVEIVIDHHAVIINGKDESFIRQIVKRIRSNNKPDIYLKPVFLLKGVNIIDPLVNELVEKPEPEAAPSLSFEFICVSTKFE